MTYELPRSHSFDRHALRNAVLLGITAVSAALMLATFLAPDIALAQDAANDGKEIYGWFFYQILTLFAWVTGLAGIVLNAAAYYTVVNMGNFVNGLTAITSAWTVLRDVGNIVLIFGFVAIGIATILDVESYSAKKMLVKLLIVAVTLNFSMFVTRAIIDVGNIVATQFYKELNGGTLTEPTLAIGDEGISNAIMGALKLTSVYNGGKGSDVSQNLKENRWTVFVLGMFLFAIATFVLFSIAFMLIGRFVILVFLMIISQLGFVGLVVPRFDRQAKEWWSKLIDQTIFAPAVMLLLLIAIKIMNDDNFFARAGGKSDWGAIMTGQPDAYQTLAGLALSFLIAMGLLMASLLIAKQLSAFGASTSTKLAGRLAFGTFAFAGRRTAGFASQRVADKIRRSSWGRGEFGRMVAKPFDYGGRASFDARGAAPFKSATKMLGVDAGKAHEGGIHKIEEEQVKKRVAYGKSLKATAEERERAEQNAREQNQERENWRNRRPLLQRTIDDRERDARAGAGTRAEELRQQRERTEAARRTAAANPADAALQQARTNEETALDSLTRIHNQQAAAERNATEQAHQQMQREKEASDAYIQARTENIQTLRTAPITRYVHSLERTSTASALWPGYDALHVNHEAAEALTKERDKTETQKMIDKLDEAMGRVGGGHSAPPTTPAPRPAPPAGGGGGGATH